MDETLIIKKGDLLKVYQKIIEGKKERVTTFMGRVLTVKGSGSNIMFTVRQMIEGVSVDRIYPLSLPTLTKIEKIEEKKKVKQKSSKSKTSKKGKK